MESNFNKQVYEFIAACKQNDVRMLLVGGSAVNYYGYKRHSADIDFWIDPEPQNLSRLLIALNQLKFNLKDLPSEVKKGNQNISIKISPDLEIELLTSFNPGKSFEEAFKESIVYQVKDQMFLKWNIISLEDLLNSKLKSSRYKDLLDVKELKRINKK